MVLTISQVHSSTGAATSGTDGTTASLHRAPWNLRWSPVEHHQEHSAIRTPTGTDRS